VRPEHAQRLAQLIATIQRRWGPDALRRSAAGPRNERFLPSGNADLDRLLGGGIGRGQITELRGMPTSGMETLTLQLIAAAQARHDSVVYLDLAQVFDPEYAVRCAVDLDPLVLVRPVDASEALSVIQALVMSRAVDVLVVHPFPLLAASPMIARRLPATFGRLATTLAGSRCALLVLNPMPTVSQTQQRRVPSLAPPHAAVRLLIERERWIADQHTVQGLTARITLLAHRTQPAGRAVVVTISLKDVVSQ
jgi:hypothetical protein